MSYRVEGKVKEYSLEVGSAGNFEFKIKLIPNAEHTLKQGDKNICVLNGDTDAKLLEYKEYIIISIDNNILSIDKDKLVSFFPFQILTGQKLSLTIEVKDKAGKDGSVSSDKEDGKGKLENLKLLKIGVQP